MQRRQTAPELRDAERAVVFRKLQKLFKDFFLSRFRMINRLSLHYGTRLYSFYSFHDPIICLFQWLDYRIELN